MGNDVHFKRRIASTQYYEKWKGFDWTATSDDCFKWKMLIQVEVDVT